VANGKLIIIIISIILLILVCKGLIYKSTLGFGQ